MQAVYEGIRTHLGNNLPSVQVFLNHAPQGQEFPYAVITPLPSPVSRTNSSTRRFQRFRVTVYCDIEDGQRASNIYITISDALNNTSPVITGWNTTALIETSSQGPLDVYIEGQLIGTEYSADFELQITQTR